MWPPKSPLLHCQRGWSDGDGGNVEFKFPHGTISSRQGFPPLPIAKYLTFYLKIQHFQLLSLRAAISSRIEAANPALPSSVLVAEGNRQICLTQCSLFSHSICLYGEPEETETPQLCDLNRHVISERPVA